MPVTCFRRLLDARHLCLLAQPIRCYGTMTLSWHLSLGAMPISYFVMIIFSKTKKELSG